jgi:putative ABC transport system ATP-binding protein
MTGIERQEDGNTAALLAAAARTAGRALDLSESRRFLEEARHEAGDGAASERLLERAAERLGLRLRRVEATEASLLEVATSLGACVVAAAEGSRWLAVARVEGGKLVTASGESLSAAEVSRRVAVAGGGTLVLLLAEPRLPLSDDRQHDGHDDHTSHDGHDGHDGHGAHPSPRERLFQLLRTESQEIGVVASYAVVIGLLQLGVPVAVQALVNNVVFGQFLQPIVVLTLLLFGVLAFKGVVRAYQLRVVELMQQRIFVRVAAELAHRLPRLRTDRLEGTHAPELVNRFFDVLTVQKSAAVLLLDGFALVLQTMIGLLLITFYHPLLLVFALLLGGIVAFIVFGLGRGGTETAIEESKAKYAVAAWLEEMARHPRAFKSGGAEPFAVGRVDALSRRYLLARRKHFRVLFRQSVGTYALHAVSSALLLGLGGWLVMTGQMTLGALVAAEIVIGSVLYGITKLGKQLEATYDLLAAVDKLGHLVDMPMERHRGQLPSGTGPAGLRLTGLCLASDDGRTFAGPISLTLAPGERAALMGKGKTVLLETLFGLRSAPSGHVALDGVDLRDLELAGLRHHVALVGEVEVFEGTVEENIRLGRSQVGHRDVVEAVARVGLTEVLAALPEGLETRLATGGAPLSEGQQQRLMLARALAGRPRLLLLDGTLDRVEGDQLRPLIEAVVSPDAPWTAVCATSRSEVAEAFPLRLEFVDGRMVAERATAEAS